MKKKILTTGKKALSLVMVCFMLMSCWVFFAPTEAEAYAYTMTTGASNDTATYEQRHSSNTDDYVKFSYPANIYLDVSETLQSVGYKINVTGHYGSSKQYRAFVSSTAWGGTASIKGASDDDMTAAFSNYDFTAAQNSSGTQTSSAGGSSGIVKETNTDQTADYHILGYNPGTINFTVSLTGTPTGTGTWYFSPTTSDKLAKFSKRRYSGSGSWDNSYYNLYYKDTSSYTCTGSISITVNIYDKSGLNTIVNTANEIKTNSGSYTSLVTSGSWSTFTSALSNAETILKTREVTQSQVTSATTELTNAINALYFGADIANFKSDLATANAYISETGYTAKYTAASRSALEIAIANANAGKYTTGALFRDNNVVTYAASANSDAGAKANTDQTNLDTLEDALEVAIAGMAIQQYKITFKAWDDTTLSEKYYDYGTAASAVVLPTWPTIPEYDDANHYTYVAPTGIADVTADATYSQTRTEGAHSFYYDDKTETTHDRKCLNCSRVIDNEPHVKANGKSEGHTCTADGYITYQCGECGQTFVVSGYILDANGNEVEDKAAHNWADLPTKIDENQHGYKCSICGEFDSTRKINHTFTLGAGDNDIIKAPTCMEDGSGNYYCTCGATKVDTIAKLPYDDAASHVIGNITTNNNGTHSGKCTVTGCDYESTAVGCTDENDDCFCDAGCGYEYTHVYKDRVVEANRVSAATCQAYAVYTKSCQCGKLEPNGATFEDKAGDYADHNWTSDRRYEFSPATCTKDAVYYYSCTVCRISSEGLTDDTWSDMDTALGHEASTVIATSGTTKHGYQCVRYSECNTLVNVTECTFTTYTDNGDGTHTAQCTSNCGNTDSDTHDMTNWASDNSAGTVAGTQSRHCTVCSYAENNVGCKYGDPATVTPTCSTEGSKTYTCTDCGHGYTVILGIDEDNHSNFGTNDVTVTPATCNAAGEYKKICKKCGEDIETGLILAVDPDNHGTNTTTTTGKVDATCTIQAQSGVVTCDGCGGTITENVIGDTNPNNHVSTTDHDGLAPTCTDDGYTAYKTCNDPNCPVKVIGKETIDALGHDFDPATTPDVNRVNKLDNGTHNYKCSRCDVYGTVAGGIDGTIDCLDAEPVYTDPECNVDGYWTHTCETCGYVWTVTDENTALVHDYSINADGTNVKDFDDEDKHAYYCKNGCETYGVGTGNDATNKKEACSGGEADCLNKAVCSVCGKEYGEALGHDFDPATTPTVDRVNKLDNGTHNYKCSRCDVYGTVADGINGTIACLDAEPAVTNPTCLTGGYTTHTCDTCGYTWETNPVGKLGHEFTEVKIDSDHLKDEATCETEATYWYDCSRCDANAKNEENAEENAALYFKYGKANGHTFDRNEAHEDYLKTPADCTNNAIYYVSCSVCYKSSALVEGQTKTFAKPLSLLGHDWVEYVDPANPNTFLKEAATCETPAVYYKSCSRCDISSKDVTGQTATFNHGTKNDHVFTEKIQDSAHRLSAATCIAKAVYYYDCINCNVNAKNLSAEDVAKYTANGEEITYEYGEVAPNAHPADKLEIVQYQAPTCYAPGHNEHKHCTLCQKYIGRVDETNNPAYAQLTHNFTGAYESVEVKIEVDGEIVIEHHHSRKCLNCGHLGIGTTLGATESCEDSMGDYVQSVVDGVEVHTASCSKCAYTTDAEKCAGGTANCTEKATCTTCGNKYGSELNHKYPETWTKVEGKDLHEKVCENGCGIDITEPCTGGTATCSTLAECVVCLEKYGDYAGHVFETYTQSEPAKCGVNAKEKATCKYCTETDEREIEGTALKHVMSDYGYAQDSDKPTCKDEGIETSICTLDCGHTVTRPVPADKDAHVWSEWVEIGGDCSTGIVEQRECSVCKATEKRTNTDNLEHLWVTKVEVKPSCEKDGYLQQYCSKCGFTQTVTEGYKATGHSFSGEFTFYSAATCTANEIHSRPCDNNCGKLEFKEIEGSMLEHDWVIWNATKPSCTMDGQAEIKHCVDCGFEEGGEIIPALAHTDSNGDGRCDSCNGQMYDDGEHSGTCTCICHKENAFMRFIFKIINFFWKLFKIGQTCDCGAVHW